MKPSSWYIVVWLLICTTAYVQLSAQDPLPTYGDNDKRLKKTEPLRELNAGPDTISVVQTNLPLAFKETTNNLLIGSLVVLAPIWERLRQVRMGFSEDTVRIVHIGDSHIRGHIYPRTVGEKLVANFGAVSYIDAGVNGATCLTFTHPDRIAAIAALKPELLVLSFGTNESHNRKYSANTHYQQMDELIALLRNSLPNAAILLTTPPGSYDSFRQSRRRRTYVVNPRTVTAANTICRYAADHNLVVWDVYHIFGGRRRASKNWFEAGLMRPDHVHYMPQGYVLQGELLHEAIIKAYNDYVSY